MVCLSLYLRVQIYRYVKSIYGESLINLFDKPSGKHTGGKLVQRIISLKLS
jgi:hypothetical protein